jgi:hypothetical protein
MIAFSQRALQLASKAQRGTRRFSGDVISFLSVDIFIYIYIYSISMNYIQILSYIHMYVQRFSFDHP